MKKLLAGAVACVMWALVPVAEAHRQTHGTTCGIKGAGLRYASDELLVVSRLTETEGGGSYASKERWYACLREREPVSPYGHRHRYRKRRHLDTLRCYDEADVGGECETGQVRAVRWRLALLVHDCDVDFGCDQRVRVLNVKTGQQASTSGFYYRIADFEVAENGTAVWLEPPVHQDAFTAKISALTLSGQELRLDEGPDLSDLAVSATTVYWKNAGEVKSAQVP